jgi:hypothetical protein
METEISEIIKDSCWTWKLPDYKGKHQFYEIIRDCISSYDATFNILEISFTYDIEEESDYSGKWLAYQYCYDFEIIVDGKIIKSSIVDNTIEEIVSKKLN